TRFVYTPGSVLSGRPRFRWTLATVLDTLGNHVDYRYSEGPGTGPFAGERHLESIAYGGVEIRLYYRQRPEDFSYAIGSGLLAERLLLKTIDVRIDGKRVRAYGLAYQTRGP